MGRKKKTQEEHVKRVREVHGDKITVVGEYDGLTKKIAYMCALHGIFITTPATIERGSGCPQCGIEKTKTRKSKTTEEHKRRIIEKFGGTIDVLGEYHSTAQEVKYKCHHHGIFWKFPHLAEEKGCSACWKIQHPKKYKPIAYTQESYSERVREKFGGGIQVLGKFDGRYAKLEHSCEIHGKFITTPDNVLYSTFGCLNKEHKANHISPLEFVKRVQEKHGSNITVLEEYRTAHTIMQFRCVVHGSFSQKADRMLYAKPGRGGCKQCNKIIVAKRRRKSHETYIQELEALNNGIKAVGKYVTATQAIQHMCSVGHVWEAKPSNILSGNGCPLCDTSQYKKRPVLVGGKTLLLQGSEPAAIEVLLQEGHDPADLAFTKGEGKLSIPYTTLDGRETRYHPDCLIISKNELVEVKSQYTAGLHDDELFAIVQHKAKVAVSAGYSYRLMIMHKGKDISVGEFWYLKTREEVLARFKKELKERVLVERTTTAPKVTTNITFSVGGSIQESDFVKRGTKPYSVKEN